MKIIRVTTGGRGRPLKIDVDRVLSQFEQQLPRAKERLAYFREQTSGERNPYILGTETRLPKSIEATIDVLDALKSGANINYNTARQLRSSLQTIQQLASKQERVFGRALANQLLSEYESTIERQSRNASKQVASTYQGMLNRIKRLTPAQQQKFFFSRGYQDVRTNRTKYQHIKKWAENDIKKRYGQETSLTEEEAFAYMLEQKQIDEMEKLGLL